MQRPPQINTPCAKHAEVIRGIAGISFHLCVCWPRFNPRFVAHVGGLWHVLYLHSPTRRSLKFPANGKWTRKASNISLWYLPKQAAESKMDHELRCIFFSLMSVYQSVLVYLKSILDTVLDL